MIFFDQFSLERQTLGTLAGLFFRLRRVDVPVLHVIEFDLVADMVLDGKLVHVAGRFRVGHIEARLREGVGRPDVRERSAAAVRHP